MAPPSTLLGALLTFALLLPGLTYAKRLERTQPERKSSAFREVANVLLVSGFALAAATFVGVLVSLLVRPSAIDVPAFVLGPAGYFAHHPWRPVLWFVCIIAAACLFAWLAGGRPPWLGGRRLEPHDLIELQSAWWQAFEMFPDLPKCITCKLDDGSVISGILKRYSAQTDEVADRDILLFQPITIKQPGAPKLEGNGAAIISARKIVWLWVEHLAADPAD